MRGPEAGIRGFPGRMRGMMLWINLSVGLWVKAGCTLGKQ